MLKGKQIVDTTIVQEKLNLDLPIENRDAATKQYVDDNRSIETNAYADSNLLTNTVLNDGELASNSVVSQQPIVGTEVIVFLNGKSANINNTNNAEGYFSPDGTYKRIQGAIRKGDQLYWNPSNAYFLDTADQLSFSYIISEQENRIIHLTNGESTTLVNDQYLFDFEDEYGSTATVIVDGTSFLIENNGGNFVWDSDNANGSQHSFTLVGENITITVNLVDYVIVWDGRENTNRLQKFTIIPS
ncbi:MAG: hypothetical protein ACC656_12435 [Candidatus Heimdallarchaeota archaeon]